MRRLLPTLFAGLSIPAALSSCSEVSGGPGSVDLSIQGQKAIGDFHGADYELRSNSAELLEDWAADEPAHGGDADHAAWHLASHMLDAGTATKPARALAPEPFLRW